MLYTPELTGTILPGITRDSIIQLARHRGYEVVEGKIAADFAMAADEAFCCGTAAGFLPLAPSPTTARKRSTATATRSVTLSCTTRYGIQNETEEDIFGWLHPLP